jgi:hypothetical protein
MLVIVKAEHPLCLIAYLRTFEDISISLELILDELFAHLQPMMQAHMRTAREHSLVVEIAAEQGERLALA